MIFNLLLLLLWLSLKCIQPEQLSAGAWGTDLQSESQALPGVRAASDLISRILPDHVQLFHLDHEVACQMGHAACFTVKVERGQVQISGTTGVELASGFSWLLKAWCNSSISWELTGGTQLDTKCLETDVLADIALHGKTYRGRSLPWHYYQNVVTVSYSSVFWGWKRWEQEIDWMALNGINLPLAFTGQEYVWQRVFAAFNITETELEGFFAGPAFLAWGRMGNLQGYGGPLPQGWIKSQADLQRKILARMRAFGMTPVFPAFGGFVPRALTAKRPEAMILRLPNWGGFPEENCCVDLLDPLDPLFHAIGRVAIQEMRREFGSDPISFYSADTFNEMLPPRSEPAFLSNISAAVYSAMAAADESAVWLMQAWTFFNDQQFWRRPQIEAYVRGVPKGKLVMLDLYAEVSPIWELTDSFSGAPFIWCMLHNFGGNSEMYGDLESVAAAPAKALSSNSSIVGFGLCPEAIEQNPVVYAIMNEWPFRHEAIDVQTWLPAYVRRRYGEEAPVAVYRAWQLLQSSVYNATDGHLDHGKDIPTSHPALSPEENRSQWGLAPHLWYQPQAVVEAWAHMIAAAKELDSAPSTLRYDLVDVGRQVLSKLATGYWQQVVAAYKAQDSNQLQAASHALVVLLQDLDMLLSTDRGFLLGIRLEEAKAAATTAEEELQFEWNLRTQITVWGTHPGGPSELEDYANREWEGLMADYYLVRWRLWLNRLADDLRLGREYNASAWRNECLEYSQSWTQDCTPFPTEPSGDPTAISGHLYAKYYTASRTAGFGATIVR